MESLKVMEPKQSWTLLGNYPMRHYAFENGLNAYLIHNPISPVAAFLTHYTVGSASEEDSERGLAHFFEHMMFRETDTLGDGDFDRIIAQSGGVGLNAFTSYDTTAFHVSLPTANLERVIGLESDRMANLKLSDELIEILDDKAPGEAEADAIIMAARAHWFEDEEPAEPKDDLAAEPAEEAEGESEVPGA